MSVTIQSGPAHRAPSTQSPFAARSFVLLYGRGAYLVFPGRFLYAIGFGSQSSVPKTIDSGATTSPLRALVVNLLLMSLFAVQHSGMARQGFKKLFARFAS